MSDPTPPPNVLAQATELVTSVKGLVLLLVAIAANVSIDAGLHREAPAAPSAADAEWRARVEARITALDSAAREDRATVRRVEKIVTASACTTLPPSALAVLDIACPPGLAPARAATRPRRTPDL